MVASEVKALAEQTAMEDSVGVIREIGGTIGRRTEIWSPGITRFASQQQMPVRLQQMVAEKITGAGSIA
ncbi:hypothetical protein ACVIIV_007046 [Bradyrhizobium sp. USDA 4354]